MQAITNDIVVSQTVGPQVAALQLSQNINNPQASSLMSFKELVASYSNENSSTSVKNESQPDNLNEVEGKVSLEEKADNVEVESQKDADQTEKISNQTKDVKEAKVSEKKETVIDFSDLNLKTVKKSEAGKEEKNVKQISKTEEKGKSVKKSESDKKLKSDMDKLENLLDESKSNSIETENLAVEVAVNKDSVKFKNSERREQNLIDDTEIQIAAAENTETDSLMSEELITVKQSSEKVSKLDKDGKITVRDLRTEQNTPDEKVEKDAKLVSEVKIDSKDTATITMNLEPQITEENVLSLNSQTAASDGSNFQAMLNNQIQNSAPEFVKAGSIILKDNNQGTINLVLHPDDMGNVKIHLSLDGKTVSAQILVSTKEAMEVFKDNAETLREAFIKSGFDTGSFNVSYNDSSSNQNSDFNNNFERDTYMANKLYRGETGEAVIAGNDFVNSDENLSNYSINIVA